jgi:hypothetical protein
MEACWFSGKTNDPAKRACKKFKKGHPFVPRVDGKLSKVAKFDPEKKSSWTFYTGERQCLVLTWDPEIWAWKTHIVGLLPDGGIATKNFEGPDQEMASWFGRVDIVGAGSNSLYTSPGYDDPDDLDEDGVVINKPAEVRLYPIKPRKGRR